MSNSESDMEFVKKFTPPDFQAKNLNRQFHLISTVLVRKNTKNEWKWRNLHRWQKILHCRRHWRHGQIPPLGFASNLFMPSTVLLTNQMGETNQVCLGLSGLRRKPTKDNLAESRSFIIHIACIVCWVKTSRLGLFLQVVVPSHHIHHKRSQLMLSSAWQPFYLTKHCKRHNRSKGCVLSPK